jgi:Metallo-beta-lactamase superfamily
VPVRRKQARVRHRRGRLRVVLCEREPRLSRGVRSRREAGAAIARLAGEAGRADGRSESTTQSVLPSEPKRPKRGDGTPFKADLVVVACGRRCIEREACVVAAGLPVRQHCQRELGSSIGCGGLLAGYGEKGEWASRASTRQDQPMSVLTKITEHVYWMPPGAPDRPSLCGVVGDRRTLMLDAGSSQAHAREFLDALSAEAAARPSAVVYTHSDWDHVFGGAELNAPVIAQVSTAEQLVELAEMDWSDEALDERVAAGQASPRHAASSSKSFHRHERSTSLQPTSSSRTGSTSSSAA